MPLPVLGGSHLVFLVNDVSQLSGIAIIIFLVLHFNFSQEPTKLLIGLIGLFDICLSSGSFDGL